MEVVKIGLILFLLLSSYLFSSFTPISYSNDSKNISFSFALAKSFLESQFVPEVSLLKSATYAEPDKFRIYTTSDNLWGARALILLGSKLGYSVLETLKAYNYGFDGKHEVILGFKIPEKFYGIKFEKIGKVFSRKFNHTVEIWREAQNTSLIMYDWFEYVDLLVYRALNHIIENKSDIACEIFKKRILPLWDGYGFADKVHITDPLKRYETYKVALVLYLAKILRSYGCLVVESLLNEWSQILTKMQREDGGVITHYVIDNGIIIPLGDANTETTSIAVIALSEMYTIFKPESRLYLFRIEITTNSDWTTVEFFGGPRALSFNYSITRGYEAPGLNFGFDGSRIWVHKKQFDTTTVSLEILLLATKGTESGSIVIKKGGIGLTTLRIGVLYNSSFIYFLSVSHDINLTDITTNMRRFDVNYTNIYNMYTISAIYESVAKSISKRVCAFYYPWYGNIRGPSGIWYHWADVRSDSIGTSAHYPLLGPYDSNDERILEAHIIMAKASGIDCFIVSWWGIESFEDKVVNKILKIAERYGFNITLYLESYRTSKPLVNYRDVVDELEYIIRRYSNSTAFLKINGKPVLFIYATEAYQRGPKFWLKVREELTNRIGDVYLLGDSKNVAYLNIFDGFYTYIELNIDTMKKVINLYKEKMRIGLKNIDFNQAIALIEAKGILVVQEKGIGFTVMPGYDDRKIRSPGIYIDRKNGQTYRQYWDEALSSGADFILITSWNEWHEGTEIEPSIEYGFEYLKITREYTTRFKGVRIPTFKPPHVEFRIPQFTDGQKMGFELISDSGATVVVEILLPSYIDVYTRDYLTYKRQELNIQTIGFIIPWVKPGDKIELTLILGPLVMLPESINIVGMRIVSYSPSGEMKIIELPERIFNKAFVSSPGDIKMSIGNITIIGNELSIWVESSLCVGITVIKPLIYIGEKERLVFERWNDGSTETRRVLCMETPKSLKALYQRQYLVRLVTPVNSTEIFLPEGSYFIVNLSDPWDFGNGTRLSHLLINGTDRRVWHVNKSLILLAQYGKKQYYISVKGLVEWNGWVDANSRVKFNVTKVNNITYIPLEDIVVTRPGIYKPRFLALYTYEFKDILGVPNPTGILEFCDVAIKADILGKVDVQITTDRICHLKLFAWPISPYTLLMIILVITIVIAIMQRRGLSVRRELNRYRSHH